MNTGCARPSSVEVEAGAARELLLMWFEICPRPRYVVVRMMEVSAAAESAVTVSSELPELVAVDGHLAALPLYLALWIR